MTVRYDLYDSPNPDKDEKKNSIHARVVTDGTVDTEDLAKKIEYSSSVTIGDVESVLSSLSYYVADALQNGKRVHIKGLGYFQMTLTCPPAQYSSQVRGDAVKFKSIAFRPEKELKERMAKTHFLRANKRSLSSSGFSEEKLDIFFTDHFKDHRSITCTELERLAYMTKWNARKQLGKLVEMGKLRKVGNSRFPYYEPVEGFYGR